MSKQIVFGPEALSKLLAGVNLIAGPVKSTLGPSGKNVIYERLGTNLPISTRDGVTAAEAIEGVDPFEAIGVNLIKGVAREAVDQSGDGTTTATLLAQSIFAEGVRQIAVGANPVALKRGIEKATSAVLASLRQMAIPVSGGMLRQVATISANNDPFLGGLIADAIQKAGPDGVVAVEVSQSPESSLQVVEGLQIGTGFISTNFINNAERNECVLNDCAIYLHESKLAAITPMSDLLKELAKQHKSFLVIAEDVTDEALDVMAIAAKNTDPRFMTLPGCAVRTPGSVEHLHDIAALTGATVHTDLLGLRPQNITLDFLGHAKKVIVKPNSTTIVSDGPSQRLEKRLGELRQQVTDATDESNRLRLQSRLARLAGGVAIIKVGAATELEMNERKDRIEDSLHATRNAEKEGVVVGGGVALARCWKQVSTWERIRRYFGRWFSDEMRGEEILRDACLAPLRTLASNGGESPRSILRPVLKSPHQYFGWNSRTGEFCDLMEAGVIDPLKVVRVALESASSIAALMLITSTLVANERK